METTLDLATIFEQPGLDLDGYNGIKGIAFANSESINRFWELLAACERKYDEAGEHGGVEALKIGMCHLLFGRARLAREWLEKAEQNGQQAYFLACALRDQREFIAACEKFTQAAERGWDRLQCEAAKACCLISAGKIDDARAIVEANRGSGGGNADWEYAQGFLHQALGETDEAMNAYDRALAIDPSHAHARFHLAYLLDLHGADEEAMEQYLACADLPYVYGDALMNLAIAHEDRFEYSKAEQCLRRILRVNPSHERAQLYLKDVVASRSMYIDEIQLKESETRNAVLDIPVTDFELSVRSRNCLKKMNINTLGDLLRTTEAELLAYKNFGETSLREIKAMLAQKGLSLGQYAHDKRPAVVEEPEEAYQGDPELLSRPVSVLQLSVRSRKCLQRLGITVLSELVQRSETELLGSRNFGQTSLAEIKGRLTDLGLSLSGAR